MRSGEVRRSIEILGFVNIYFIIFLILGNGLGNQARGLVLIPNFQDPESKPVVFGF